jgi:hypothetical protein
MSRPNRLSVPAAITVVAVAVIALIASGVLRPTPVAGVPPTSEAPTDAPFVPSVPPAPANPDPATPAPATPEVPAPSLPATPVPATPVPATPATPAPSVDPDGEPDNVTTVDLDVATDHDVRVTVVDDGGSLVGIRSGHAGDGMSVRWFDLKVENVDSSTLRLTWIGFAADDESVLNVGENDGRVQLALSVAGPPPNSDATGYDRVLVLEFDHDVSAGDVTYTVQEGFDTSY